VRSDLATSLLRAAGCRATILPVRAAGCDLGQGWFLGRPAAPADVAVALRDGVLLPADGTQSDRR
jgi:EAL domain-containing protein (putative c-di-GMP-specific phosphodiesterase class I)